MEEGETKTKKKKKKKGEPTAKLSGKDLDDKMVSLRSTLVSHIQVQDCGVYVQASTLASVDVLVEFLNTSKIPYSKFGIGPVGVQDVEKASAMLEHDPLYAAILAFDVKVESDAREFADAIGVRIFEADIMHHLLYDFTGYKEELKQKGREQFKNIAVFPCKLRILPDHIYNNCDPIVVRVVVEAGVIKTGTPLCVPSKEFMEIGVVKTIEINNESVEIARDGLEVHLRIENVSVDVPKMVGRDFEAKDVIISKISRKSIDACKVHFKEVLTKTDWQVMKELKVMLDIP